MNSSSPMKHRCRASHRGAALVEAAVVMPVIVTFLGMMMWFHNLHVVEQDTALKARYEALSRASHGCGVGGGNFADSSVSDALGPGDGSNALAAAGKGLFQGALSLLFSPSTVEEHGVAQGGLFASAWTHDVHHTSKVMCNEPKYPDGLLGLLPFATNIAMGAIKNIF